MKASELMRLPLAKLEWTFETCKNFDGLASAVDGLYSIADHCTRVATYLESRLNGRDHAAAVKAQNAKSNKVRRAIGYTLPNQPITF